MTTILKVYEDKVILDDNGTVITVDIKKFFSPPKVGQEVIIRYDALNEIDIVYISQSQATKKGLTTEKSLKIVSIFSIVFGALSLLGIISGEGDIISTLILGMALIACGILMLIFKDHKASYGITIGVFVIHCIGVLSGLIYLFLFPLLGLLTLGLYGVPFSFSIVYFVKRKKELS